MFVQILNIFRMYEKVFRAWYTLFIQPEQYSAWPYRATFPLLCGCVDRLDNVLAQKYTGRSGPRRLIMQIARKRRNSRTLIPNALESGNWRPLHMSGSLTSTVFSLCACPMLVKETISRLLRVFVTLRSGIVPLSEGTKSSYLFGLSPSYSTVPGPSMLFVG